MTQESNKTPSHWVLDSRFSLIEYDWESDGSMLEEGRVL
jgi:hypothetical protein